MFGSKRIVEALLVEQALNAELRVQLARVQANFDWLAAHVNELKVERAALLERLLGLQLQTVATITRAPTGPLPGADPGYQPPAHLRVPDLGDILAKARESVDAQRQPPADPSLVHADMAGISFEDMGDTAAAAAGIEHAPDGTVRYRR